MNKIEEKHLEAIENVSDNSISIVSESGKKEAATSCAEITKEYAGKFSNWKAVKGWYCLNYGENDTIWSNGMTTKRLSELWDLFINDLNEKG